MIRNCTKQIAKQGIKTDAIAQSVFKAAAKKFYDVRGYKHENLHTTHIKQNDIEFFYHECISPEIAKAVEHLKDDFVEIASRYDDNDARLATRLAGFSLYDENVPELNRIVEILVRENVFTRATGCIFKVMMKDEVEYD